MKWPWRARRTPDRGVAPSGTFVVEAEFHRAEELRADVVGVPSEDEIRDDVPHDPWRPSKSLGRINYRGGR